MYSTYETHMNVVYKILDSFPIGVSTDSCPLNGPWQWCHLIRVQLVSLDCGQDRWLPTNKGLGHQALKAFATPSDHAQVSRQAKKFILFIYLFIYLFFIFIFYIFFFYFFKDSLVFMRCPNTIKERLKVSNYDFSSLEGEIVSHLITGI